MTESTDQEFTDGLSPRVVHHDPRLPSQHTLDARQLRLLHRAIDALAFTAEQYRQRDTPEEESPDGAQRQDALEAINKAWEKVSAICDGRERWTMSIPAQPDSDTDLVIVDALDKARRALSEPTLPRGVAELIDATTSAWQPIMSELIEQQARFQRGD